MAKSTKEEDEYEKERQENIQRNRELLLTLGLKSDKLERPKSKPVKRTASKAEKLQQPEVRRSSRARVAVTSYNDADRAASRSIVSLEPMRKSARLSRRDEISYGEGEEDGLPSSDDPLDSFRPAPRLKKLANPHLSPSSEEDDGRVYERASLPARDSDGNLIFENNNRHFRPNVTPKEMLQGGIFGGTAFRPYHSRVLRTELEPEKEMAEFPADWFDGLDRETRLCRAAQDKDSNRFGQLAGQSLEEWENQGWVRAQDPRGWWQWYFRFYLGRRSADDSRQIGRWLKACGPSGRFKRSLVSKVERAGSTWDDEDITPVVRQTLFHWGYKLTEKDYQAYLPDMPDHRQYVPEPTSSQ